MTDPNPNDGTFEIKLRLLGNEVFAISITADPLNKRWVSGALLITIVTVAMISLFHEPLSDLSQSIFESEQQQEIE